MPPRIDQLGLDDGKVLATLLRRFYPLLLGEGWQGGAAQLSMDLAFDLDNPLIQQVLGELAQQVKRVADTTKDDIQRLIGRQAEEGWSVDELAKEIAKLGEIHSKHRAELIAKNETALAYTKGSVLAYESSGVVAEIEWLATNDDRTTERCRALHGTRIKLGETWDGDMPPRFPGCRCTIIPVLKAE